MTPERRCTPRYSVAVEIQVNNGTGVTSNFSSSGVYFETAEPLMPNEHVSIVFPFDHAAPGARASCSAHVRRVDRLAERYGVAASYDTVSFDVRP